MYPVRLWSADGTAMRDARTFGAAALVVIVSTGLGLVGCTTDDPTSGESLPADRRAPDTVTPSSIWAQSIPSDELWPQTMGNMPVLYLAPLSGNQYLVGSQSTDYPGWGEQVAWFVADSDGEWQELDPPPVDGVVQEGGLARSDEGAVFGALVCADVEALTEPAEPGTTCGGGYRGIELWTLTDDGREWTEVGMFPPDAFQADDPEQMSLSVLGAANGHTYLSVRQSPNDNTVFRIDNGGGQPEPLLEVGPGTFLKCVTARGQVVAVVDDSVFTGRVEDLDGDSVPEGLPPRLAWTNEQSELIAAEGLDIPGGFTACGATTAAVLGPTSSPADALRFDWVHISLDDGSIVQSSALPEAANQSEPSGGVAMRFLGAGTDDFGLVVGEALDPTAPSRVAILPVLGSEPLEHTFGADEGAPQVMAAARLDSGEVVVLLAATTATSEQLQVLLAR